eukprot:CAMPEP_0179850910 /NCGR_PEP_ID=MMETSP0982-20121206/7965_1 /TAXON_ID=483367 /ORGANISM="non described non described, Strain CCMP 2436" /LENGTH=385 /DNA_ID=CAMNT_0021736387 /DNA_START=292 /DNA_END=1452 /DNA_ORIENTATION=-
MAELLDLPAELLALVATRLPRDGELAASLSCRELRQAVAAARLSDGLTRTTTRIRSAFDSSLRKLEWAIAAGCREPSSQAGSQRRAADCLRSSLLPRAAAACLCCSGRVPQAARAWSWGMCSAAASGGHLATLMWLRANGCPWQVGAAYAAVAAATDVLRWAHTNGCPWGWWEHEDACLAAAGGGHLATLQWLRVNGYRRWRGCMASAAGAPLRVLPWLRATTCPWACPWGNNCTAAARGGHLDVLTWLRAVDCPWGEGSDTCRQREGVTSKCYSSCASKVAHGAVRPARLRRAEALAVLTWLVPPAAHEMDRLAPRPPLQGTFPCYSGRVRTAARGNGTRHRQQRVAATFQCCSGHVRTADRVAGAIALLLLGEVVATSQYWSG